MAPPEGLQGEPTGSAMATVIARVAIARLAVATLVIALAAVALMTAGAQAQMGGFGGPGGGKQHQSQPPPDKNDAKKLKADDKAYNAALKTVPDKKYDPWHSVR